MVRPRIVPNAYVLLAGWRYLEESLHRILCAWGWSAGDWEDKLAVCHHVWLQAEIVERMRRRLDMFPGGKPDQPVASVFEDVGNAVLQASDFRQAMAGVYEVMDRLLTASYAHYAATTHPVHDKPTVDLLAEVLELKAVQARWYASLRKRYPYVLNARGRYAQSIERAMSAIGDGLKVVECDEPHAQPVGKRIDFRYPETPGRVRDHDKAPNVMPFLTTDWSHSVRSRRLFFMIGYFWEMGVAESQLRWIYYADFMPWAFRYAESRHMWDESRHGNSGLSRLRDAGLDIADIGYDSYGKGGEGLMQPMTPADVYQAFYNVTQIAETGYFETKRYCFEDFDRCGDDASAEMMQFDIIDETSHVEYARIWLEAMGKAAGVQEDYRQRGKADRLAAQKNSNESVRLFQAVRSGQLSPDQAVLPDTDATYNPGAASAATVLLDDRARNHYDHLLAVVDSSCPLKRTDQAPVRPNLPM